VYRIKGIVVGISLLLRSKCLPDIEVMFSTMHSKEINSLKN